MVEVLSSGVSGTLSEFPNWMFRFNESKVLVFSGLCLTSSFSGKPEDPVGKLDVPIFSVSALMASFLGSGLNTSSLLSVVVAGVAHVHN